MSITDELREWVHDAENEGVIFVDEDSPHSDIPELLGIADRIDAEHAVKVERLEKYRAAVDAMPKEYVKLPVDADGVPIHVGDELTDGEYTFTVYELAAYGNGSWSIRNEDGNAWAACDVTHHEPDSWESIIADALKFAGNGGVPVGARFADYTEEFVERCRRLAGEDE